MHRILREIRGTDIHPDSGAFTETPCNVPHPDICFRNLPRRIFLPPARSVPESQCGNASAHIDCPPVRKHFHHFCRKGSVFRIRTDKQPYPDTSLRQKFLPKHIRGKRNHIFPIIRPGLQKTAVLFHIRKQGFRTVAADRLFRIITIGSVRICLRRF